MMILTVVSKNILQALLGVGLLLGFLLVYGNVIATTNAGNFLNQAQAIKTPTAIFRTEILGDNVREMTIQFDYQFENETGQAYITWNPTGAEEMNVVLIAHPIFDNLDWQKISNGTYTLYQRAPTYNSIDDFWNGQERDVKIMADPSIAYQADRFTYPEQVTAIADDSILEEIDYIITTYQEPRVYGSVKHFSRTVPLGDISLMPECENQEVCGNYLVWKLDLPSVSDTNSFLIDNVDVNFVSSAG